MNPDGGPAIPVSVNTDRAIMGGTAIPVYGYASAPTDGRPAQAGAAMPVRVLTAADLVQNGGTWVLEGRYAAMPVYTAPASSGVMGGPAIAVYPINAWPPSSAVPAWAPTDLTNLLFWGKRDGVNYQDVARTTPATKMNDDVMSWSDYSGNGNHIIYKSIDKMKLSPSGLYSNANGDMTIPNGIAANTRAVSMFLSGRSLTPANQQAIVSLGGANKFIFQYLTNKQIIYNDPNIIDGIAIDGTWLKHGVIGSVANLRFIKGATTLDVAALPADALVGGIFGGVAGLNWNGFTGELIIYSRALSAAEQTQVINYLARWDNPLYARLYVFDGDSQTNGFGLADPATQSYPAQVMALYNNSTFYSGNLGVNSQTTADMTADGVATIDPHYDVRRAKNIVLALCGTNDLYGGANAATTYNRIVAYHTARRAAGYKTVAFTILPRSDGGTPGSFEADRQTVNTNIRNNWAGWADALADVAANATIGDAGDEANPTYYQDLIHLTTAGYAIVAGIAKTAADTI